MDFSVKFDGLTGYVALCDNSQKWQCLVFAPRFQRSLPDQEYARGAGLIRTN